MLHTIVKLLALLASTYKFTSGFVLLLILLIQKFFFKQFNDS